LNLFLLKNKVKEIKAIKWLADKNTFLFVLKLFPCVFFLNKKETNGMF
jgi:hypothetical protein